MLDRVTERRRAAQLARHYREQEGCRSRRSLVGWDAQTPPSRAISTIRPAIRHARSRRDIGECVAAAGRPPRPGTARATPTRIANAAIPARLRGSGPGNGFARRCALGERATALRRPPTTGREPTHAGAEAKRSNDYEPENGPRRPPSSSCTGPGRRPSRTPSAAPERSGVNAVDIRTRHGARPPVNGSGRRSPRSFCHCVRREARGREPAVVCQQPSVVRRPKFRDRGRSRPRRRRDYRNQWRSHREHRRRLTRGPSPKRARELRDRPRSQQSSPAPIADGCITPIAVAVPAWPLCSTTGSAAVPKKSVQRRPAGVLPTARIRPSGPAMSLMVQRDSGGLGGLVAAFVSARYSRRMAGASRFASWRSMSRVASRRCSSGSASRRRAVGATPAGGTGVARAWVPMGGGPRGCGALPGSIRPLPEAALCRS